LDTTGGRSGHRAAALLGRRIIGPPCSVRGAILINVDVGQPGLVHAGVELVDGERKSVCTENLIRIDKAVESAKLAERLGCSVSFWPSWPRLSGRSAPTISAFITGYLGDT
jgi:hypothetical protein